MQQNATTTEGAARTRRVMAKPPFGPENTTIPGAAEKAQVDGSGRIATRREFSSIPIMRIW
jgi:hypothetical protein